MAAKETLQKIFGKESLVLVVFSGMMFALSSYSVFYGEPGVAKFAVIFTDLYLIVVLSLSAIRSDCLSLNNSYQPPSCFKWFFPSRFSGLIVVAFLLGTLVFGFAGIYLSIDLENYFNNSICTPLEAIYFSFVTITTLGYGDYYPIGQDSRIAIMCQLGSGILLLFGVFPLLISRLSNFTK